MQSFILLWLAQYVTVDSFIGALLLMSASVAGFTAAYLVGFLLEFSHMWLIYACLTSCLIVIIIFVLMNIIVKIFYKDNQRSTEKEVEALQHLEKGEITSVLDSHKSVSRIRKETLSLYASHTSLG